MPSEYSCDCDTFAIVMEEMMTDILDTIEGGMPKALRAAAKEGKQQVRENAASKFDQHNGKYVGGWSYKVKSKNGESSAEIGNSKVPGLPHLLEKGHAKVGGGRVAGRTHIQTAANAAGKVFEEQVWKALEEL